MMTSALQAFGRLLVGALFVISGARKFMDLPGTLGFMQSKGFPTTEYAGYPAVELLLWATIALEIVGGLMLITGLGAKLAAFVLALFTLASGVIFHNFWAVDAAQYAGQLNHFIKNIAIVGGLLYIAGQSRAVVRTHL
jgi:putative oxidoreductase